jgi:hypothetical protein
MAKRTPYRAGIVGDGLTDETTAYAMNSAIRATETLVRDLARREGPWATSTSAYHGARPARVGDVYTRVWTSDRGRPSPRTRGPWSQRRRDRACPVRPASAPQLPLGGVGMSGVCREGRPAATAVRAAERARSAVRRYPLLALVGRLRGTSGCFSHPPSRPMLPGR